MAAPFVPLFEGARETSTPHQITTFNPEGVSSGLAPWLRQGTGTISYTPREGGLSNPVAPEMQDQASMADAVRGQTLDQWRQSKLPAAQPGWTPGQAGTAEGARVSGLFSPEQNLAAIKNVYANRDVSGPSTYDPGHMDYSGEVATYVPGAMPESGAHNWSGMLDQYNPLVPTDNKFANWYFENEGDPREGERIFDRKWIKDFDTVSKLPEYTAMYGKPPPDATDQEKLDWMGLVNTGGSVEAMRQSTMSENAKTDMTEAAIMMAVSAGMGAMAAPAALSSTALAGEAAALGAGSAYGGAAGAGALGGLAGYTPSAWTLASTGASGAFGADSMLGGDIPQQAALADTVRTTSAVPGSPYYEWLVSQGRV